MITRHAVHFSDSRNLSMVESASIDLVVTSPPYPMIEMWDSCFAAMNQNIKLALESHDGRATFKLMHGELDAVWREVTRVLRTGGILCVNIGDATRSVNKVFRLYANHARIAESLFDLGLDALPVILWRKQTNAPNKFMGSGMLPAGAYVTLEHEYIMIFRKGDKRAFSGDDEKSNRRRSAIFWEERNTWYSDIWDFKGARQALFRDQIRTRSAAFPPELAYRLVCMFSVYGDTVLDPFLGTGTTSLAAAAAGRNSVGIELDKGFEPVIKESMRAAPLYSSEQAQGRLRRHLDFLTGHTARKGEPVHFNGSHGFPVVTSQETDLELLEATGISQHGKSEYEAEYTRATLD